MVLHLPKLILFYYVIYCVVGAKEITVALNWTLSESRLPYKLKFQSAGYCGITQSIWLFGGYQNSISTYHINTEAVTRYNDLPYTFRADASYNIKNGIIYFNPYGTPYISRFFTTNASFNWDYIHHPSKYLYFTVTTSMDNDILYILGGNGTKDFYIHDLDSSQWFQGHNYVITQSKRHSAPFLTQNRLIKVHKTSLEYIDITGSIQRILLREWVIINMDDLTEHNSGIVIDNEIWFIGGYGPSGSCCAKAGVQIIDTNTFDISYGNTPITFSDSGIAFDTEQDIIYVLSGWSDNVGMLDRIYIVNEYNASLDSFDEDTDDSYDNIADIYMDMSHMSVAEVFCIILGILLFLSIIIIVMLICVRNYNKNEEECKGEMDETDTLMFTETANESGIGECEICMEHKKQYAFVKCGHLVCVECAAKIWKSNARICPFCKQNISSIIKLYGLQSDETN